MSTNRYPPNIFYRVARPFSNKAVIIKPDINLSSCFRHWHWEKSNPVSVSGLMMAKLLPKGLAIKEILWWRLPIGAVLYYKQQPLPFWITFDCSVTWFDLNYYYWPHFHLELNQYIWSTSFVSMRQFDFRSDLLVPPITNIDIIRFWSVLICWHLRRVYCLLLT